MVMWNHEREHDVPARKRTNLERKQEIRQFNGDIVTGTWKEIVLTIGVGGGLFTLFLIIALVNGG